MNQETPVPNKETKEKYEALTRLLDEEYVLAHLDATLENVLLPEHLMGGNRVTLKLSRLFRGGLDLQEDKIVTDLLFNGRYFTCQIPLVSIWGLTSAQGAHMIWPESVPKDVLEAMSKTPALAAARTLEAEDAAAHPKPEITPAKPAKKQKNRAGASHLKRIK